MKVANKNVGPFERRQDLSVDFDQGNATSTGRPPKNSFDREIEYDARNLIVAIVICVICWAALGFFLLS